jgi:hypothetical protein
MPAPFMATFATPPAVADTRGRSEIAWTINDLRAQRGEEVVRLGERDTLPKSRFLRQLVAAMRPVSSRA